MRCAATGQHPCKPACCLRADGGNVSRAGTSTDMCHTRHTYSSTAHVPGQLCRPRVDPGSPLSGLYATCLSPVQTTNSETCMPSIQSSMSDGSRTQCLMGGHLTV